MKEISVDSIIERCHEYDANNAVSMTFYSLGELTEWRKQLMSLPYDQVNGSTKRAIKISNCIKLLGSAINYKRQMLTGKRRIEWDDDKLRKEAKKRQATIEAERIKMRDRFLTKNDLNKSYLMAQFMLKEHTHRTLDGKTYIGRKPMYFSKAYALDRAAKLANAREVLRGTEYEQMRFFVDKNEVVARMHYESAKWVASSAKSRHTVSLGSGEKKQIKRMESEMERAIAIRDALADILYILTEDDKLKKMYDRIVASNEKQYAQGLHNVVVDYEMQRI